MRLLLVAVLVLMAWPAWATTYFVDDGASGANNGTSTGDAWTSLDTAISSIGTGDSIIVCQPHAETLSSNIEFGASGTAMDPIVVIVDDGTYWPDSTGTPTITCNAYYAKAYGDDYWIIDGISFYNFSNYCVYFELDAEGFLLRNCKFSKADGNFDYCVGVASACKMGNLWIEGCVFDGTSIGDSGQANSGQGVVVDNSTCKTTIIDCTFDDLSYAINIGGNTTYMRGCVFGGNQSNTINTNDVTSKSTAGNVYAIDCTMSSTPNTTYFDGHADLCVSAIFSQTWLDDSKRPVAYFAQEDFSVLTDYSVTRSGGGKYSLKVSAGAERGLATPMMPMVLAVHADSAETRDYTIYAYRDANWDPKPEAEELYLEVTYSSGDTLATAQSTATLSSAATWTALTVSDITPNHDGPVLCTVWLKDYDADGYIYIDPRLVATGESYHETINWGMPDLSALPPAATGGFPQIIQYLPDTDSQWRMACFAR